jgi:acyl-CoA thioester hydrolase
MAATMSEAAVNSTSPSSALAVHTQQLRVRYSETDQMGTFYNSRPLEWFECGRTELLRSIGLPYAELEARGVFLPLVESHVEYLGRARYDDLLQLTTRLSFAGRARLRCDAEMLNVHDGKPVVRGYTVHALTDPAGKPIRPPAWLLKHLQFQAISQTQLPDQKNTTTGSK